MGILKTVELADFLEKNAKRIRILKTVGSGQTLQRKMPKEWEWNAEKMRIRMLLFERAN